MHTRQTETTPARRSHRWLLAGAAAVVLLAGSGAAWAHRDAEGQHGGWSPHAGMSVERIGKRADRMLKQVDATAEQQARVHAIIEAAAKDVDPLRQGMAGTRAQLRTLLTAPEIDRAAVEALRSQRIAAMDQISQRVSRAMVDAAEVLSPDQRQKLGQLQAEREAQRRANPDHRHPDGKHPDGKHPDGKQIDGKHGQ